MDPKSIHAGFFYQVEGHLLMGHYSNLILAKQRELHQEVTSLHLFEGKNHIGLLWLACFRQDDIGDARSYVACEVNKARKQFEEGIGILRKAFPDTNFDGPFPGWDGLTHESAGLKLRNQVLPERLRDESYVGRFRRILRADGGNYLILDFTEFYNAEYLTAVERALKGFDDPDQWFEFEGDVRNPRRGMLRESGAKNWGYALRGLCASYIVTCKDPECPTKLHQAVAGSVEEKRFLLGGYLGIFL